MRKLKLLISDTHFGVRQNSITWLNSQLRYFSEQILPFLSSAKKKGDEVTVYVLGDVFDSRSSINPFIYYKVQELFALMRVMCKSLYIVGGNHDYYSPNYRPGLMENSIDMLIGGRGDAYCIGVTSGVLCVDNVALMPWFEFNEPDLLSKNIEHLKKEHPEIRAIFTHTDIVHLDADTVRLIADYDVWSGHIHTPTELPGRHCIGSCFPLTFADCEPTSRFSVVLDEDNKFVQFIENNSSIKFWRLEGKQLENLPDISDGDYVEIISDPLKVTPTQEQHIKELNERCRCRLVLKSEETVEDLSIVDLSKGVESMCKEVVPDYLREKFELVVQKDHLPTI